MCPIAHVPHWPCATLLMCQKDVKLSKRCQMSKSQTHRLWRRFTKKINWHNEVHTYWHQFWRQIWRSPKLFKNTFYAHFEGFWWPSYVTSKLTSKWVNLIMSIYFFFVNLLHSLCVWLFDIWHLFDNLTSFWQLDIFLTHEQCGTWVMGHMGNGAHSFDTFKLKPPQPITGLFFLIFRGHHEQLLLEVPEELETQSGNVQVWW